MGNLDTFQLLNLVLIVVIVLILLLGLVAVFIILNARMKKQKPNEDKIEIKDDKQKKRNPEFLLTRTGKEINSIYKFMEFDEIVDGMISRKNRQQYVMILDCKGINYDLLSQEEKDAVELGFTEVLNTLRFPIQLYVQTRTFSMDDLLKVYNNRIADQKSVIDRLSYQINEAKKAGNNELLEKLLVEKRKRQNMYEYALSIEDYTVNMGKNRNILQQRTYLVLSYYTIEHGDVSKYSKEELNDIAFSELYTRARALISALSSAEVTARILTSEELAELLYIAYNRDEAEVLKLREQLNAHYDAMHTTAKDIFEEKKRKLDMQVERDAAQLATNSMLTADKVLREMRKKQSEKTVERAKEMVDEYKDKMSATLYNETKNQIDIATAKQNNKNAK